jgi:hypothetical protein
MEDVDQGTIRSGRELEELCDHAQVVSQRIVPAEQEQEKNLLEILQAAQQDALAVFQMFLVT